MTRIVITQSMLFPWVGLLEQIRLADVLVHYDDVQFSKGSFTNRVQVKTPSGTRWMTIPLEGHHLGQTIEEVRIPPAERWAGRHMALLTESFESAPFAQDALAMADAVFSARHETIAGLARASMMALADYFGLTAGKSFLDVSDLGIGGASSARVFSIVSALSGTSYVTGLGALNYLDHGLFDNAGISVDYMDYQKRPYSQGHGAFTPYVTGLDLMAWCGKEGREMICSGTRPHREMIDEPA